MDECVVVFCRFYTEIVSGIFFFSLARQTSHCGQPPDGVSFLTGSGNVCSLSLIGRALVGATCFLSTRHLQPSKRLAMKERRKSN